MSIGVTCRKCGCEDFDARGGCPACEMERRKKTEPLIYEGQCFKHIEDGYEAQLIKVGKRKVTYSTGRGGLWETDRASFIVEFEHVKSRA
jgi:hypothetical protein